MATKYEYKSLVTGKTFTLPERLTEDEMKEQNVKRVWGGDFIWPMSQRGH